MSVDAMGWVFKHSPYSSDRMVIHLAMADYANDDHDYQFWASVPTLARKAKCSERTVQNALRDMESDGMLVVIERSAGGSHEATSTYRLVMPGLTGESSAPVHRTTATGANDDITPITNRSKKLNNARDDAEIRNDFEWLWKRYPKKAGKSDAWKKYLRLRRTENVPHDQIVSGVRNYVRRCRAEGRDVQYIKGLAVVLGPQRVWADELERTDPIEPDAESAAPWSASRANG